jgi:hypothetical protein
VGVVLLCVVLPLVFFFRACLLLIAVSEVMSSPRLVLDFVYSASVFVLMYQ